MRCNFLWTALALVFVLETVSGDLRVEAPTDIDVTDFTKDKELAREIIYRVKINDLIDRHIDVIDQILPIVNPPKLDDVKRQLTSHVFLLLNDGYLRKLSSTRRIGDCILTYRNRVLSLDLNFAWQESEFDYKYLVRFLLYKRTGLVRGNVHNLKVNIGLDLDFKTYEARLNTLDFIDSGKISLKLEGKLITDWIYNLMIKSITTICRKLMLESMEAEYTKMIQRRLDELNSVLGKEGKHMFKFVNMLHHKNYARLN